MSVGLSDVFRITFDEQIKAAYQGSGVLRKHVRVKPGVVGSTHKFRRYAKGVATPRLPQTDVVPMGTGYAQPEAIMQDWIAAEYTDVFDQAATDIDEMGVVATNIAAAIGRREDQIILVAADAANAAENVGTDVGANGSGLNMAKLRRTKRLLDERAVPMGQRCFVHSAEGLEQLLGLTEVTSTDFNTVRALINGEVNAFLGFVFAMIEERAEGGLPKTGQLRTNFAFDMMAVGLAISKDYRNEVNYVAEKTSWLASGLFKAGAVSIDPEGVLEVLTTEAA